MKNTELMVGDLVLLFDKYPAKVEAVGDTEVYLLDDDGVHWNVGYEHIKPIPLTPEILEKNGFKNGELNVSPQYFFEDGHIFIGVTLKATPDRQEGVTLCKNINSLQYEGKIEFVHELQHALRLCGIDKEITI